MRVVDAIWGCLKCRQTMRQQDKYRHREVCVGAQPPAAPAPDAGSQEPGGVAGMGVEKTWDRWHLAFGTRRMGETFELFAQHLRHPRHGDKPTDLRFHTWEMRVSVIWTFYLVLEWCSEVVEPAPEPATPVPDAERE